MEKHFKERKRLQVSIGLARQPDLKSPPITTPTFLMFDDDICPVITDRDLISCSRCCFYQEKLKVMHDSNKKNEDIIKNLNLEIFSLKDLHKSSTVHAMIKKLELQGVEIKRLSQETVFLTEENSLLKEKLLKSEKEIEYLKQNIRKTIKEMTYPKKSAKHLRISTIHSFFVLPDPLFKHALTDGHENFKIFITEQKEENERLQSQIIPEILNTESTKTPKKPEQHLKTRFLHLSSEFSELVILFQSFVDLVLFNNSFMQNKNREELENFERKTDSKKVIFHLLTSINQKLVSIKKVFQLVEGSDQGQDLNSSSVSNFSHVDENIRKLNSKLLGSEDILRKYSDFITNSSGFIEESSAFSSRDEPEKNKNSSKSIFWAKLRELKKKIKKLKKEKRVIRRKVRHEINETNQIASEYIQIIHLEGKRLASIADTEKQVLLSELKQKTQENRKVLSENLKLKQEILELTNQLDFKLVESENFEKTQEKLNKKVKKLENYLENLSKIKDETSTLEFLQDKESIFLSSPDLSQNHYSKLEPQAKTLNFNQNLQFCQNCQENYEKTLVLESEKEMLYSHIADIEEQLSEIFGKFDLVTEENRLAEVKLNIYLKRLGFEQLKGAILKLKLEKLYLQVNGHKNKSESKGKEIFFSESTSTKNPKVEDFSRISKSREELF